MMTTTISVRIGQSDLLNFALVMGGAQQKVVEAVKCRPAYDPQKDYWKRLRDRIATMHRNAQPLTVLDDLCKLVPDKKKANYTAVVAVYKRFLGHKTLVWFTPQKRVWAHNGLIVGINPELGLEINGTPHVIKLYFSEETLSKDKAAVIIQLMENALQSLHPVGTVFSILDVPRNKLVTNRGKKQNLMPLLRGWATAFVQMYQEL